VGLTNILKDKIPNARALSPNGFTGAYLAIPKPYMGLLNAISSRKCTYYCTPGGEAFHSTSVDRLQWMYHKSADLHVRPNIPSPVESRGFGFSRVSSIKYKIKVKDMINNIPIDFVMISPLK
jgi:hypothetical protein